MKKPARGGLVDAVVGFAHHSAGAVMSNQKFDLSNVGGQPKDWDQKDREYRAQFSAWQRTKFLLVPVVCLVAIIAGLAYFVLSSAKLGG